MRLLIALAALVIAANSFGCDCAEWPSARLMFQGADAVFVGRPNENSHVIGTSGPSVRVQTEFRVLRSFKNVGTKVRILSEQGDGGNCGTDFRRNEGPILVFAYRVRGKLTTDSCGLQYLTETNQQIDDFMRQLDRAAR
jgi:hypothetical protein